ncbi:hypothetical protein [Caldisphaera sp.]|uniref:hypothetical protein n=1 Tax=Caldisphaera sp. TaxID=2060322 RepID=UPI003D0DEF9A
MMYIGNNILWRTFDMDKMNFTGDKFNEVVRALSKKALNSFMGAYILLDSQSKVKFNMGFVELLLRSPENACILAREALGEQFMFLIKSILVGNEFNDIRNYILNSCKSYLSSS